MKVVLETCTSTTNVCKKSNKRRRVEPEQLSGTKKRPRVVEEAPGKWTLRTKGKLNGTIVLIPKDVSMRQYILRLEKFLGEKIHIDDIEYYALSDPNRGCKNSQ